MASHTHSYDAVKSNEKNCWNECACGDKINVMAHAWNHGVVTKDATHEEEGEKTYTCTSCLLTKVEKIEKLVLSETDEPTKPQEIAPKDDTPIENEPAPEENSYGIVIAIGAALVLLVVAIILVRIKKRNGR